MSDDVSVPAPQEATPEEGTPHRAGAAWDVYGTIVTNVLSAGDTARHQMPAQNAQSVILRAARANTGTIYVGGPALAQPGTDVAFDLGAGDSVALDVNQLSILYYVQTVGADRLYATVLR